MTSPQPDTPAIPPALSADEWSFVLDPSRQDYPEADAEWIARSIISTASRHIAYGYFHKAAALCLYAEQPYGFTHEDVDLLRRAVVMERYAGSSTPDPEKSAKLRSLASRIQALLPPPP